MNKKIMYESLILLTCMGILPAHAMSLEQYIAKYNPDEAETITYAIYDASRRHDVDPLLLASIFHIESTYNQRSISPAGAIGISQLMPDTAGEMGVNPYDMMENIDGGASYLSRMLDYTDRRGISPSYALAAYNAGPGSLDTGIPSETYQYMADVEGEYNYLRETIDGIPQYGYIPSQEIRKTRANHNVTKKERLLAAIRKVQGERHLSPNLKDKRTRENKPLNVKGETATQNTKRADSIFF